MGSAGGARHGRPRSRLFAAVCTAALVLLAALVTFPAPIPGGPSGLRTTEFVSLAANGALILALLSGAALHRAAVPIGIAAVLTIPWIWAEVISISTLTTGNPARFALVRWTMGLATGYWLAVLMDDDRFRRVMGAGMVLGLVLSLAAVMHDWMTFDESRLALLNTAEEQSYSHRWVDGEYRAAGLFGHPNNAASIVLLMVPLIIGLVEERRLPRAAILVAAIAVGAVFITTKTRGPTIISVALLAWYLWRGSPARRVVLCIGLGVAFGAMAAGGLLTLSPGENNLLVQRFTDTAYASENLDGRLLTTLASFELALAHPLGLGSSYIGVLIKYTGWDSTHNAYGQLALMGGLPLALFTTVRLLANALLPASPTRVTESWVAVYVAGAFLFENQFFSPSFVLITIWLLRRPSSRAAAVSVARGAAWSMRRGGVGGEASATVATGPKRPPMPAWHGPVALGASRPSSSDAP